MQILRGRYNSLLISRNHSSLIKMMSKNYSCHYKQYSPLLLHSSLKTLIIFGICIIKQFVIIYLNDCVCYKYITALLRLHIIFILHGGARRPRGRLAPILTGPSCPIHTSADLFTFTHNPLISLPFSMKVIETYIVVSTSQGLT